MSKGFRSFSPALLAVLVLLIAAPASADVIYRERIEDASFTTFLDLFDGVRSLTRTRTLGDGTVLVETDDATIVAENLLTDNWGLSTANAFNWSHLFVFDPPVGTFLQGTLTLEVIGAQQNAQGGQVDLVFVESFIVGVLSPGGVDTPSTTLLTTAGLPDPTGVLATFLADLRLDVGVLPLPLFLDFMTIKSSTVEVSYVPVPEPATMWLVTGGLAVGGWRRYRSRLGRHAASR
jgi:hypothetical protein